MRIAAAAVRDGRRAEDEDPYRYLEVRGRARDADGAFAKNVGAKFGADLLEYDRPDETRVVVTVDPLKIHRVVMG